MSVLRGIIMDVICPIYWVDEELFENNLKSWLREIPFSKIYLGVNNESVMEYIEEISKLHENIIVIDQTSIKTLGKCLTDLMKLVSTEWFAYLHSDALLTEGVFGVLKKQMKDGTGMIESDRYYWGGAKRFDYSNYYLSDRAFSGFQLIRLEALTNIIDIIEDDYIYRNEDLIFQNACLKKGFNYVKTCGMHVHQGLNRTWTFDRAEAFDMQWRGIVKYTDPSFILLKNLLNCLGTCKTESNLSIYTVYRFCRKHNKKWKNITLKRWV